MHMCTSYVLAEVGLHQFRHLGSFGRERERVKKVFTLSESQSKKWCSLEWNHTTTYATDDGWIEWNVPFPTWPERLFVRIRLLTASLSSWDSTFCRINFSDKWKFFSRRLKSLPSTDVDLSMILRPRIICRKSFSLPLKHLCKGRSGLSTWKYQFSYDHWSQAMLSSV